ncbi:hypothetical protein APS56_01290 [Pseudalgibacter alginicilyticus]|uniref:Uncharacterized protein n=1 Tax=Pseudalgibacter alginicilyticus TaxID=1736674 RepID=A0A0P0CDA0_9FLAO|nr:hypothetical protein [Pseudalgibacter alginicilyticus]ALJ03867.1 hypothetical protein APS56_01290 [Pseudalgibacter alginicilyticus]
MTKFRLTLVTENQKSLEKGKKFADQICEILDCNNGYEISKYEKFVNSYRIEIIGQITNKNSVMESIELTDRICSPWIVTYDRPKNNVELIFNKSDLSNFRDKEFNVLNWAQFEIENE